LVPEEEQGGSSKLYYYKTDKPRSGEMIDISCGEEPEKYTWIAFASPEGAKLSTFTNKILHSCS